MSDELYRLLVERGYPQHEAHAIASMSPRSSSGASGCGHVPAGYSCVTPGCSNGPAPEPTETLYTAKDVEALFAIRDAAVAAHAAKPVATAWMRDGVIENAFPRPPRSAEEWAKYDADGYWKAKGYSEAPLYSAPPSPPEPRDEPLPPCSTCGGETVPFCTSCGYTTTKPAEYPAYTECQHDHMKPNPTLRATYPKHGSQSGWVQEYRCNVCQCSFERPIATAGLRANGETP